MRQGMVRFLATLLTVTLAGLAFSVPCAGDEKSPTATGGAPPSADARVVVYYFHGNLRCSTCRNIEAYSEKAIKEGFADDLTSGRLDWRVVNTDEPENKHFVQDFELVTGALVLAEYRDDKVTRHENLQQVWQLVWDEERFLDYVRTSTRKFLRKD